MYSLRYGTPPIVRAVGGLEDTVIDFDGSSSGTGFKFTEYTPAAMMRAIRRALEAYRDRSAWSGLQERGMAQDFSWDQSAQAYERLFASLLQGRAGPG
jgi:starch synthase